MATRDDAVQPGWTAHDRNGDKIGDVEQVGPNYILVTKGLIFTTDLYIPRSVILDADADSGSVVLDVDRNEVDDQGWTEPPATAGVGATGAGTSASEPVRGEEVTIDEEGGVLAGSSAATGDAGAALRDTGTTDRTAGAGLDEEQPRPSERGEGDDTTVR